MPDISVMEPQPIGIGPGTASAGGLRILFTEGASLSARQTLYPLGGRHTIDVIDPDPLCQCRFSSYVRRWRRSPSFAKEPEEFLTFLAGLVRGGEYDVILPTHEQVYLLSRFRDAFTPHVGIALPAFAAMERMQNKANFKRLLEELDLPQPKATIVRTREELDRSWEYPFYLKLAHSTAGGGVFYVRDEAELLSKAAELERCGLLGGKAEAIVQQPARGTLSTVQAVFNHGQLIGVHSFESRQLGVGGMSTARVSADHPIVREHVARLGAYLDWHGAFFVDYFYGRDAGRPEYIECNPRIGETVNAMLSGVNLPELLVRVSVGDSPAPVPLGKFGVRTHNIMMALLSKAFYGGGRRELWREIREHRAAGGRYEDSADDLIRPSDDPLSRLPLTWVALQLLVWPKRAKGIVARTIDNYSLPEAATERIKSLPLDLLAGAF